MLPPEVMSIADRHPAGLFSNRQVARVGHGSWDITRWLREDLIERLAPGWYRVAGRPPAPLQDLHLAQEYLRRRQRNCTSRGDGRPPFLLTGAGALRAMGLDLVPARPTALIDRTRQVRLRQPPFEVVRCDIAREVPVHRRGLALVEVARAIGDHAADPSTSDLDVRLAVDGLRYAGSLDIVEAARCWSRREGSGFARLRRMLRAGDFEQESEGERRLVREVLSLGGPMPDCQVWLSPRIRVDFVFLAAGLVLEHHGEESHANRVDEDALRGLAVRRLGYDVLVTSRGMLRDPVGLWRFIHETRRRGEEEIRAGRRPLPSPPLQRARLAPLRTLPSGMSLPTPGLRQDRACA